MSNDYKMCLDCIYSDLTKSERVQFRLSGKKFVYECVHTTNYFVRNTPSVYKETSQLKHNCPHYIRCS